MITVIYDFTHIKGALDDFDLRLLMNVEELNNTCFNEVFSVLNNEQQHQYNVFKESGEAKKYRTKRNAELPYVDFNNLPEELDEALLEKIMPYQKDGEVRRAIYDLLSETHKAQMARFEWAIHEKERVAKRALMSDEEKNREQELKDNYNANPTPRFNGNMGEPDTVEGYIEKYGVDPRTGRAPEKGEK